MVEEIHVKIPRKIHCIIPRHATENSPGNSPENSLENSTRRLGGKCGRYPGYEGGKEAARREGGRRRLGGGVESGRGKGRRGNGRRNRTGGLGKREEEEQESRDVEGT